MTQEKMYSGFKICKNLKAGEKCFRLQKYNEGEFVEVFHEHVPKYRISSGNSNEFMRALISRYSGLGDPELLRAFINKSGKEPSAIDLCRVETEYPEEGVLRKYYSSTYLNAWFDEVISPDKFRKREINDD